MNAEAIPQELRDRVQWVNWSWRWSEPKGKWDKPPLRTDNGRNAAVNDPKSWGTFDAAYRAFFAGRFDGVGFVFTPDDDYFGLDLDKVLDPETGELLFRDGPQIIAELNTYAELSPSGSGFHAIGRGKLPVGTRRRGNVELYDSGRYFTFTGAALEGSPLFIRDCGDDLAAFHARLFPPSQEMEATKTWEGVARLAVAERPLSLDDDALLTKARSATNGERFAALFDRGDLAGHDGDASVADLALTAHLSFWTAGDAVRIDRLFRRSKLYRLKWDERHSADGRTYGQMTISRALASQGASYGDAFTTRGLTGGSVARTAERLWPEAAREEAFYGLAGEIVHAIDPYTEADPIAVLANLLTAFGNAVGRGAWFPVGASRHHPHLYFALVGKSAKARKGESWSPVRAIFGAAAPEWSKQITSGLSSGEGLIYHVRDEVHKSEPIKEKGQIVGYQDVCVDDGVEDKRMLVIEPELGRVLRSMERQGNTLSMVLRDAWDGNTLKTMTRSSPLTATEAHVSLVGHVTQEELMRELSEVEQANGFANRFIMLAVQRSKLLPDPPVFDAAAMEVLLRPLSVALEFGKQAGQMQRSPAARAMWEQLYPVLSADKPGLAGAIAGRAEAHVLRLAMVYALLDSSAVIEVTHLVAAHALWLYAEGSLVFLFGDATGDSIADTIRKALTHEPLTRTQISAVLGRNVSTSRIDTALTTLTKRGLARVGRDDSHGGRPAEVWELVR